MKANKAPEKIYLEKVYPDNGVLPNGLNYTPNPTDIEYIRTDAFIDKVCNAYCKVCKIHNCRSNECKWISDFKGHLENI